MSKDLPFTPYLKNIYSQSGEDGVIAEIISRLNLDTKAGWCCEFGAWDGKHISNTFALVQRGYKGVYIEGNNDKFLDLVATSKEYQNIIPINSVVSRFADNPNSLDHILLSTAIPRDFEVLSIDIDSYDLDVWESLTFFHPKIVVIEINSSIPPGILLRHDNCGCGNSFSSTVKVGVSKGYTLVCHTGNLIFVHSHYIHLLKFPHYLCDNPELLFIPTFLNRRLLMPG